MDSNGQTSGVPLVSIQCIETLMSIVILLSNDTTRLVLYRYDVTRGVVTYPKDPQGGRRAQRGAVIGDEPQHGERWVCATNRAHKRGGAAGGTATHGGLSDNARTRNGAVRKSIWSRHR